MEITIKKPKSPDFEEAKVTLPYFCKNARKFVMINRAPGEVEKVIISKISREDDYYTLPDVTQVYPIDESDLSDYFTPKYTEITRDEFYNELIAVKKKIKKFKDELEATTEKLGDVV